MSNDQKLDSAFLNGMVFMLLSHHTMHEWARIFCIVAGVYHFLKYCYYWVKG